MVTKETVHFVIDYLIDKVNNGVNLKSNNFTLQYKTDFLDLEVNIKMNNCPPTLFYHFQYQNQSSSHRSIKGSRSYFYNYLKISALKKLLADYQQSNINNTQTVCFEEEIKKLTEKNSSIEYNTNNEDPAVESMIYDLSLDINSWNKTNFILRSL